MAFVRLIELDRCSPDRGTFVAHAGHELAVFRLGEPTGVVVIDNACPHASGNLSGGALLDNVVTCPWHQWAFDLRTGICTNSPRARVRRYRTEVRDGAIWVELPGGGS